MNVLKTVLACLLVLLLTSSDILRTNATTRVINTSNVDYKDSVKMIIEDIKVKKTEAKKIYNSSIKSKK